MIKNMNYLEVVRELVVLARGLDGLRRAGLWVDEEHWPGERPVCLEHGLFVPAINEGDG